MSDGALVARARAWKEIDDKVISLLFGFRSAMENERDILTGEPIRTTESLFREFADLVTLLDRFEEDFLQ